MIFVLLQGFLIGLLGSFHCIGMCGPIALLLPVDSTSKINSFFQSMMYNLGRTVTYSIMGLLLGLLGKGLYIAGFQGRISILMGIIMVLAVVFPTQYLTKFGFSKPMYKWVNKIKKALGNLLLKKSKSAFFTIGLLNGLLPCGLVYIAMTGAVAMGDPFLGALFMFLFGLGTSPMLSGLILMAGNLFSIDVRNKTNRILPYFVVFVGIIFILRGMGLGIKSISPSPQSLEIKNKSATCY